MPVHDTRGHMSPTTTPMRALVAKFGMGGHVQAPAIRGNGDGAQAAACGGMERATCMYIYRARGAGGGARGRRWLEVPTGACSP